MAPSVRLESKEVPDATPDGLAVEGSVVVVVVVVVVVEPGPTAATLVVCPAPAPTVVGVPVVDDVGWPVVTPGPAATLVPPLPPLPNPPPLDAHAATATLAAASTAKRQPRLELDDCIQAS